MTRLRPSCNFFRAGLATAAACVATLAADDARADLQVTAPAECPDGARIAARVAELTPGRLDELDADVRIEQAGSSYRAHVTLRAPARGERTLEGDDCASLESAVALVLAMTRGTRAEAEDGEGETATVAAPPAAVGPASPPAAPTPTTTRVHVAFRASASAALALGVLSEPSPGGQLDAGLALGPFRVALVGRVHGTDRVERAPGVGGDLDLAGAGVRACHEVVAGPVVLGPCVGGDALRITARGVGTPRDTSAAEWMATAAAGGAATWWPTRHVGLRFSAEVFVLFGRPTFVIENAGAVHRPALVAGTAAVGPEVRF